MDIAAAGHTLISCAERGQPELDAKVLKELNIRDRIMQAVGFYSDGAEALESTGAYIKSHNDAGACCVGEIGLQPGVKFGAGAWGYLLRALNEKISASLTYCAHIPVSFHLSVKAS